MLSIATTDTVSFFANETSAVKQPYFADVFDELSPLINVMIKSVNWTKGECS